MNFSEWYQDADMPQKDENGNWFDLETGIYFQSSRRTMAQIKAEAAAKPMKGKARKDALQQLRYWADQQQNWNLARVTNEELIGLIKTYIGDVDQINEKEFSKDMFNALKEDHSAIGRLQNNLRIKGQM